MGNRNKRGMLTSIYNSSSQNSFELQVPAIWIFDCPDHPCLGVSPDGIISCDCCGKGVLKIKCPYKHRNISVQEAAKSDKDFCLDETLNSKITHRYYTQVQMQICITKCQYCDFVVFTKCQPASIVIVRVSVNEQFCSALVH